MVIDADELSEAEFDDQAGALVGAISRMHGDDRIAAACRGSANPAALEWLADTLEVDADQRVCDLGAGLGGPAAWIRDRVGCTVVAADPFREPVAAARELFGVPVVQATATSVPLMSDACDAALLLGVLSVVEDRVATLHEARRVAPRVAVLDYCFTSPGTCHVGGSHFPAPELLADEMVRVWPDVRIRRIDEPVPQAWQRAADRARAGVPTPASERAVVAAIEAGRLRPYAFVGR